MAGGDERVGRIPLAVHLDPRGAHRHARDVLRVAGEEPLGIPRAVVHDAEGGCVVRDDVAELRLGRGRVAARRAPPRARLAAGGRIAVDEEQVLRVARHAVVPVHELELELSLGGKRGSVRECDVKVARRVDPFATAGVDDFPLEVVILHGVPPAHGLLRALPRGAPDHPLDEVLVRHRLALGAAAVEPAHRPRLLGGEIHAEVIPHALKVLVRHQAHAELVHLLEGLGEVHLGRPRRGVHPAEFLSHGLLELEDAGLGHAERRSVPGGIVLSRRGTRGGLPPGLHLGRILVVVVAVVGDDTQLALLGNGKEPPHRHLVPLGGGGSRRSSSPGSAGRDVRPRRRAQRAPRGLGLAARRRRLGPQLGLRHGLGLGL